VATTRRLQADPLREHYDRRRRNSNHCLCKSRMCSTYIHDNGHTRPNKII